MVLSGGGVVEGHNIFTEIISVQNLFSAWKEFKRGKMNKIEVQDFLFNLEDNIFDLHDKLSTKKYYPNKYEFFYVRDPKLRPIHKAKVKDRVVFQAVFRILYHIFDRLFIFDSYSCRFTKGTHAGVKRLKKFVEKASQNYSRNIFVLKCDVKQFFYSIDHKILLDLFKTRIKDQNTLDLIEKILNSFRISPDKGLPLGNVTSQLFANIYLNELDQFVKHILKEKYYIRYCDDFVIISHDFSHLENLIPKLDEFLKDRLQLILHPRKIEIRKLKQGIDFLGYVTLSHFCVLRTKTKKRMFRKLKNERQKYVCDEIDEFAFKQSLQSYLGILKHSNSIQITEKLLNEYWLGKE